MCSTVVASMNDHCTAAGCTPPGMETLVQSMCDLHHIQRRPILLLTFYTCIYYSVGLENIFKAQTCTFFYQCAHIFPFLMISNYVFMSINYNWKNSFSITKACLFTFYFLIFWAFSKFMSSSFLSQPQIDRFCLFTDLSCLKLVYKMSF